MNSCSIENFISTKVTNNNLKELLSEFFKEHNLLSKDIFSITDDIKRDLSKEVMKCKLFDEQYSDIMVELKKANMLPKEDIMWQILESSINLTMPAWVRELNPIKTIKGSRRYIFLLVGTREKGVVSLKDILPLIRTDSHKLCCLILKKGKYYILVGNPNRNVNSDDNSTYLFNFRNVDPEKNSSHLYSWIDYYKEHSWESLESVFCVDGEDEDYYYDLEPEDVYYFSNLDKDGLISLQDYIKLTNTEQGKIDRLITAQESNNNFNYIFGLGYTGDNKFVLVIIE